MSDIPYRRGMATVQYEADHMDAITLSQYEYEGPGARPVGSVGTL